MALETVGAVRVSPAGGGEAPTAATGRRCGWLAGGTRSAAREAGGGWEAVGNRAPTTSPTPWLCCNSAALAATSATLICPRSTASLRTLSLNRLIIAALRRREEGLG